MNPPKHDPETLYAEAKKIVSLEERKRFLQRACGDDQALKIRLESLLQAGDRADSFFEDAAFPFHDSNTTQVSETLQHTDQSDLDLKPNDKIGPYKLMEKVGEGGFGVVWAAEQREPIKQRVALKIIKVGMDTKQVVARFEAERQALALMNHPNIAKVLGAGSTENGRPYFCMELIRGIPITQYCDENKLNTQERLDLFTKVCHAIQHAHQKGVIHRDIKPANILVTLHDGVPVPKVIDFGVAKAVEMELTEKTIYTQIQQFIGTPAYMSPEQAEMSGLDIDTRSDIYSLGVLLYELLTGRTPFSAQELMQSGLDEMRRMIREKDPERPSMRLSSLQGEERTTAAQRRNIALPELIRSLRGDLDWIVIKALEKDRTRRYETANGLAADIKRHLENEPIIARPPSTAYRLQKAWQRNKGTYVAVACVFMALLVGAAVSFWQAQEAKEARDSESVLRKEAEDNAELANQLRTIAEENESKAIESQRQMRKMAYMSDLKLANHALLDDDLLKAKEALNRHRPKPGQKDIRDMAWRYLWTQSRSQEKGSFKPHDNIAPVVDHSPDGLFLMTGGFDRTLKIWDAKSRDVIKSFDSEIPSQFVRFADFSPDGQQLAMIDHQGELLIRDTSNWEVLHRLGKAKFPVLYSPDGSLLSARTHDSISLWKVGEEEPYMNIHPPAIRSKHNTLRITWRISPDAKKIHATFYGYFLKTWDTETGAEINDFHLNNIEALALSPSGKFLAGQAQTGHIRLFDTEATNMLAETGRQNTGVFGLEFSPDGTMLVSAGNNQLVRVWSVPDLKLKRSFKGHENEVWKASFSPDGKSIASAGKEDWVRFWDINQHAEAHPYTTLITDIPWKGFDGNGELLGTSGKENKTQTWRISDGMPIRRSLLQAPFDLFHLMGTSKEGFQVAVVEADDWVTFYNKETGTQISQQKLTGIHPNFPLAISPDGKWLIGGGTNDEERHWKLYHLETSEEVARLPCPQQWPSEYHNIFSPDGQHLIYAADDFSFRAWHLETQKEVAQLSGHTWWPAATRYSHDGSLLATGSKDGVIQLWDAANFTKMAPNLKGHTRAIHRIEFSPDNKILLSGSSDLTVRFWDVETGLELLKIPNCYSMRIEDDGNSILIRSCSCGAMIVQLPSLQMIDQIDGRHPDKTK